MDAMEAAVVVAVIAVVVVARMYARRSVAARGSAISVVLLFGMPMVIGAVVAWIGLVSFNRSPVGSLFLVALGLAWLLMGWRLVRSISQAAATAATTSGRADALFAPLADFALASFAMGVVSAIVGFAPIVTGLWR